MTNKLMVAGVPGIMWMERSLQFGLWDGKHAIGMPDFTLTTKRVYLFPSEGK